MNNKKNKAETILEFYDSNKAVNKAERFISKPRNSGKLCMDSKDYKVPKTLNIYENSDCFEGYF